MSEPNGSEPDLSLQALYGDRDDVRTVGAWLMAVDGRLHSLDTLMDNFDNLPDLARAWDGLDNHALCDKLEVVFDALKLYEDALKDE